MPARRGPLLPTWARILLPLVLLAGFGGWRYSRPIPAVLPSAALADQVVVPGTAPQLPWPTTGSAAVSVPGLGVLGTSGKDTPAPIASVAKVMTALVVLADKPLQPGNQGPVITITDSDVADLRARVANVESVVAVASGERITEYQVLEGLLLPSGNNMAQLLARWDTGSTAAMVDRMNARAADLGMSSTKFADPAGVSPQTVSTARDLTLLGRTALGDAVLTEIVGKATADLPIAGTVFNIDQVLGKDGIVGIKTGSSPDAGSCFLFASTQVVGGRSVTVLGAILGQTALDVAFSQSRALAAAVGRGLLLQRVVPGGLVAGRYRAPWGASTPAIAASPSDLLAWPGLSVRRTATLRRITAPVTAGATVGDMIVSLGEQVITVPIVTSRALPRPGQRWRLLRID